MYKYVHACIINIHMYICTLYILNQSFMHMNIYYKYMYMYISLLHVHVNIINLPPISAVYTGLL